MVINPVNKKTACYCGSHKDYENCCCSFLTGRAKPENPEQLMRSRYSAFCTKDIDYLISTHHPSMQTHDEREVLARTIHDTQWLGLKVLRIEKEQAAQDVLMDPLKFGRNDPCWCGSNKKYKKCHGQ